MDYKKTYDSLIKKALAENRRKGSGTYYESHHIVPISLGGPDNRDNRVLLTAREHFVCHWLLWKFCTGEAKFKMGRAFGLMRVDPGGRKLTSVEFEASKRAKAEAERNFLLSGSSNFSFSGRRHSDDSKKKISSSMTGRKHDPETKKKIGLAHRGKTISLEQRDKIRKANMGNQYTKGKIFTSEHRRKISEARKATRYSNFSFELIDPDGNRTAISGCGIKSWFKDSMGIDLPASLKASMASGKPAQKGKWKNWQLVKVE